IQSRQMMKCGIAPHPVPLPASGGRERTEPIVPHWLIQHRVVGSLARVVQSPPSPRMRGEGLPNPLFHKAPQNRIILGKPGVSAANCLFTVPYYTMESGAF